VFCKIDNDELNELYSPNIRVNKARKITQAGYLACMGRKLIQGFSKETLRNKPIWGHRRTCEHNIKMYLQETRWHGTGWFIWLRIRTRGGILQTRQWSFVFHKMRGIFLTGCQLPIYCSRRILLRGCCRLGNWALHLLVCTVRLYAVHWNFGAGGGWNKSVNENEF